MSAIPDPSLILDEEMFALWLEDMDPRLYRFVDFLRPDSVPGDYSRDSLEALEAYLLERYPQQDLYLHDPDVDFIDGAVRYVGETYLRAFGGGWHYSDDPRVAVRHTPYLLLGTPGANAIAPYYLMSALLHRRTGQVLVKVWDSQRQRIADRQAVDRSFVTKRESVPGIFMSEEDVARLRTEAQPFLDTWLPDMEERIDRWRAGLPAEMATRLDGTVDSLPVVQELLLDRYADANKVDQDAQTEFIDGAVRYIGTLFQRAAGGEWRYIPGEATPTSVLVGRPFLTRKDRDGDDRHVDPFRTIRGTVHDRTLGAMTRMFHNYAAEF